MVIGESYELPAYLIGTTMVVLVVNFMGAIFAGKTDIALPIAALGLFVGLRAWAIKMGKE